MNNDKFSVVLESFDFSIRAINELTKLEKPEKVLDTLCNGKVKWLIGKVSRRTVREVESWAIANA